ncbi:MAG: DUF4325 domain-containing protein [Lachnospiraceae bacterium]|nr:DUF4325 domain-containing protein [Lachnospiraceae bacterium]
MSFTDKKREEIKKYILRKIALDDAEVISKTMDNFGISITSVKRYLQEAIKSEAIMTADDCECGYKLVEHIFCGQVDLEQGHLEEDRIFEDYIAKYLKHCNEAAFRIWQYTCQEMLNNAIEHSRGGNICIEVHVNTLFTKVIILDDGVGTFRTLVEYMSKNGWENPREEDALIELYKGKITSNAACHSGEGIFFSSKMTDEFMLWSDARVYMCGNGKNSATIQSHLLAYASRIKKIGTIVCMSLENETERRIGEVFDMYTNIEEGFIKTHIPVKEACINGEPVARSQARRICNRLEEFKEVIFDFSNVEFIGQGFADEVFRVYAVAHPQVVLCPMHMVPEVERMIRHVGRGKLPENVRLPY